MNNDTPNEEMMDVLRKAPKVALFSHVSPDGDCLGTMLAVGLALEKMGKEVLFYNGDTVPGYLGFLPGSSRITKELPNPLPSILMFVDCTDLKRVNLKSHDLPEESIILNLDHHVSNQYFGDFNWVDSQASASGEVAIALIESLGVEIDKDIASNLYAAIVTDTGCFQYSNTTANTHRLIADLLDKKIDLPSIHHQLFDQKPLAQVKLLQCALNRLEINEGGEFALMTLSIEDFHKCGAGQELSEGLVDHARSIIGVEVAALLKEKSPQEIKVSMRSNRWLDVNQIAAQFGGGGHKRAAGCALKMTMTEAKQRISISIEEALRLGRYH